MPPELFMFEAPTDMGGGGGGVAAPADPAAGAADPGQQPVEPQAAPAVDPAALTPEMIEQFVGTGQEMTAILREAAQLAQGAPGYERYAPPQPQAPPEPQVDPVQAALADFDPFNPQSIQGVLAAQAEQMQAQFAQQLEQQLAPLRGIVEDVAVERGEQAAKVELDGFQAHIQFPIDHEATINEARAMLMADDQLDERTALWQAANRIANRDRQVSERAVQAYRERIAAHVEGGSGDLGVAGGHAGDAPPPLPTGSGKYAEMVRRGMRARSTGPAQV